MVSPIEQLTNDMGGFRRETAHIHSPGFPGWDWLPFVRRGWKWDLNIKGRYASLIGVSSTATPNPIILRPGETWAFPLLDVNQPQWLISIYFVTNSPFTQMDFQLDDWSFNTSYQTVSSIFGNNQSSTTTKWLIQTTKPKFISPVGPLYPIFLDPIQPVSVTSSVSLKAILPANAPVANAEVMAVAIGRVIVSDYNIFLDEVRKTAVELEVGQNIKQWQDAQSSDGKLIADIGPSGRRTS